MEEIMVSNIKDDNTEYIKYYLSGYLNYYKVSLFQSGFNKYQYKKYKIRLGLIYFSIPLKFERFFELLSPFYLPMEFILSFLILLYKFIICSFHTLRVKKEMPERKTLMMALNMPIFKLNQILNCYPQKENIKAVQIPFIHSETPYETYSVYSVLKFKDCVNALILSVRLLFYIFKKYYRYDFLFRAYSSYEFFLSCMYVKHSDESNRFLFVSTIDRWAYLMGNDTKHLNIFIQHGIVKAIIRFFKYKAPHTAYFIDRKQQACFEQKIFWGKSMEINYRPRFEFTSNEKLRNNGKINILVICCNKFLDLEIEYIPKLAHNNKYNIYIKLHPGFNDHSDYYALQNRYDLVVLDKEDYPRVDKVLSYDSTLAYEYEDNGVPVLRYSDTSFNEKFRLMIDS